MKGNKEFLAWWDHWMSRIHPNRTLGHPGKANTNDVAQTVGITIMRREINRTIRGALPADQATSSMSENPSAPRSLRPGCLWFSLKSVLRRFRTGRPRLRQLRPGCHISKVGLLLCTGRDPGGVLASGARRKCSCVQWEVQCPFEYELQMMIRRSGGYSDG